MDEKTIMNRRKLVQRPVAMPVVKAFDNNQKRAIIVL